MTNLKSPIRDWQAGETFVPLLAMLLLGQLALPFSQQSPLASVALTGGLLLACIPAVRPSSRLRYAVTAGLVVVMVLRLAGERPGLQNVGLTVTGLLATAAYVGFIAFHVFAAVVRTTRVTANAIMGAICVYVLVSHVFALLFFSLEVARPGSLAGLGPAPHLHEFLYFSVITMTTLGFGDVIAVTPAARVLVMLEAMSGQLFMAVFVARLVGSWAAAPPPEKDAAPK